MAPTYRTEELLKFRNSVRGSEDVVRKMNKSETAVQDHVLRSSSSNVSAPARTRGHASSAETTQYEHYERIPPDDFVFHGQKLRGSMRRSKNSPTASIKRGKAEKLLKEHGSPPGVRVTAGGRIVPHGLAPLSSPQHPPALLREQHGCLAGAQYSHQRLAQTLDLNENGIGWNVAPTGIPMRSQVNEMSENMTPYALYSAFPQDSSAMEGFPMNLQPSSDFSRLPGQLKKDQVESQIYAATEEYRTAESDLKALDREEVINRLHLTKGQEENNTRQRIILTNRLDSLRKSINDYKHSLLKLRESNQAANYLAMNSAPMYQHYIPAATTPQVLPPITPSQSFFFPGGVPMYMPTGPQVPIGYAQGLSPSSTELQHNIAGFGTSVSQPTLNEAMPISCAQMKPLVSREDPGSDQARFLHDYQCSPPPPTYATQTQLAEKDAKSSFGLASCNQRRSHALEIKNPKRNTHDRGSPLDPESPAYKPSVAIGSKEAMTLTAGGDSVLTMASPEPEPGSGPRPSIPETQNCGPPKGNTFQSDCSRTSSVSTTDFFPNDTPTYSMKKYQYDKARTSTNLPAWFSDSLDMGMEDSSNTTANISSGDQSVPKTGLSRRGEISPTNKDASVLKVVVRDLSEDAKELCRGPQDCVDSVAHTIPFDEPNVDTNSTSSILANHEVLYASGVSDRHLPTAASLVPGQFDSEKYIHGYRQGLSQEVLGEELHSTEFYKGYRDGLLDSAQATITSTTGARSDNLSPEQTTCAKSLAALPQASRTSSFPSLDLPPAPFNSSHKTLIESVPINIPTLLAADKSSKVTREIIGDRRITPSKASMAEATSSQDMPSPLSARNLTDQRQNVILAPLNMHHRAMYDKQRSPTKSKPSTAASSGQVQTHTQLDGDGDEALGFGSAALKGPPTSPTSRPSKGCPSPVKSFAMASISQFSFRTKKGIKTEVNAVEQSVPKPSESPTKRRLSLGFGSPKKRKPTNN